jgi:hypothetical protein
MRKGNKENLLLDYFLWEKVRTRKIRTSKFKKNIENASKHQNIESVYLSFHKSDQNIKNRKDQLPMAYYLWIPRPVGG